MREQIQNGASEGMGGQGVWGGGSDGRKGTSKLQKGKQKQRTQHQARSPGGRHPGCPGPPRGGVGRVRGGLRPRRAQPGDAVSPRAECRLVRLQPPGAGPHEAGDAPIHRPFMLVDPRGGPPAPARRQLTAHDRVCLWGPQKPSVEKCSRIAFWFYSLNKVLVSWSLVRLQGKFWLPAEGMMVPAALSPVPRAARDSPASRSWLQEAG